MTSGTYLALFVFFLVLPIARRFKFSNFIEFESKVEQVRAEVKEVRTETRELVSTVSNVASAISASMRQTVVVNVPNAIEAKVAQADMEKAQTSSPKTRRRPDVQDFLQAYDSDIHYGLARLRMDLEREIRTAVEDLSTGEWRERHWNESIRSMFRRLVSSDNRYATMKRPLDFVLKVCNAAVHGQTVEEDVAYEAVEIGLRILEELNSNE